ncbi:hypothetical protein LXA43DRAFT_577343 [Ganoderma leucocontextum]|nr:hypothetical protein LXA43DRAFT_577343 [Ganoderma leucocontextum]
MHSPQNDDQRSSTDNTVAVKKSPIPAECELRGASPSRRRDLSPRDRHVPGDFAQAGCPHRSSMRRSTVSIHAHEPRFSCVYGTLIDGSGVMLGRCSNCTSGASACSAHETSPGLRRPSYEVASMAQSSSTSARQQSPYPQLGSQGIIVAQHNEVRTGRTSDDANVTQSPSMEPPPSHLGIPRTTLETLEAGRSNTSRETSTLGEPNSDSPDMLTTQTNDGLYRASILPRAVSVDGLTTSSQSPQATAYDQVPQQSWPPAASATIQGLVNHPEPELQKSSGMTTSTSGSLPSWDMDMQPSTQQTVQSGTSNAYPAHVRDTSFPVSSLGISSSNLLPGSLTLEHTTERYVFDPYAQYFCTS